MAEPKNDFTLETSTPTASLDSILCTDELHRRPSRPPDYERENRALVRLVSALADSPGTIFQTLAETILDITQAHSAGISLLTGDGKTPDVCGKRFFWPAIAGLWKPYIGGGTPRDFGPCGDVLDRNCSLLFRHLERRYTYFPPPINECLLVPFYVEGKAVGTMWALAHDDQRKFDAEDDRLMNSLGKIASSAYQALKHIDDLKVQVAEREKAEAEVRELASGLEAKVRRLVEANVVGIAMWNLEGAIVGANEAFLRMVQYSRQDIVSGRVRWTDLTPAEWCKRDERAITELKTTGVFQPFEKEYFRKDGSRVPVLLGGALLERSANEGVAFILDLTEQKRAEEALRQSESCLAQAQKLAHIGSWAWAIPRLNGLYVSEEWYRIWNFDPRDGMPAWEERLQRIHPEDRAQYQAAIDRAITVKSGYDAQFRILCAPSTLKYIHSVGHPVLNSSGELLQFVGVTMDVTEQKHAEEALRSSQAYLMEAQRLTHTGSCAIDGKSREIQYWSNEMFQIFGFDSEQGLPKWDQWVQRIHPNDRDKFRIAGDRTFLEKVQCDAEFRIVKPDGALRYIHGIGHPVLSPSGELVQIIGTMVDVTERKRAEEERERLRQAQRVIVETANDAVVSADESGAIQFANPATMRVFGYDPKELIGKPLTVLMPEFMREVHENGFRRYLTTGQRHINWQGTELSALRKNGQEFPVEISFGELTLSGQRVFTGFIRDITERKQAEEERERLRQVQADLARMTRINTMGELTASLAHEIRQPLTAALTNAETCLDWLRRDHPDVEEGCEAAVQVVCDVSRASGIINSVSALFKKGPLRRGPVDVNGLIQEMVSLLRNEALRHSVTIRAELDKKIPRVNADRLQLQQVFMNLMLNGIDAMKNGTEKGELVIKSEIDHEQLLISVIDAGIGLPPDHERMFKPFFTTKEEGTGMGLAISRSIVESHGGRLWATANKDQGATLRFTLPLISSTREA